MGRLLRSFMLVLLAGAAILTRPGAASAAPDLTPPPTPANFHVVSNTYAIFNFCWDPVVDSGGSGLAGYVLFRNGIEVLRTTATCGNDNWWLKPDTAYQFKLKAYDDAGNYSNQTPILNVATDPSPALKAQLETPVILLRFADFAGTPFTPAAVDALVFGATDSVDTYYREISFGKTSLTGQVYGWYDLPLAGGDYCTIFSNGLWNGCDYEAIFQDAQALVPPQLDLLAVDAPIFIVEGLAIFGYSGVWIGATHGYQLVVIAHELAHTLWSLGHAGDWDCPGPELVGPDMLEIQAGGCTTSQYGDPHDLMGGLLRHPSAWYKRLMGFLEPWEVETVTQSGTWWIGANEMTTGGLKMLEIPLPYGSYFVEYRFPFGVDAVAPSIDGVLVRFAAHYNAASGAVQTFLPRVAANPVTGSLVLNPGIEFDDPYRDIQVRVLQKAGTVAQVQVEMPLPITIWSKVPSLGPAGLVVAAVSIAWMGARRVGRRRS